MEELNKVIEELHADLDTYLDLFLGDQEAEIKAYKHIRHLMDVLEEDNDPNITIELG